MAATYKFIASSTVGAGGAATVTFSSIPQTYTDLKVLVCARSTAANAFGYFDFNSSSANFSRRTLVLNGSAVQSYSANDNLVFTNTQSGTTASTFNNAEIYIPNYTSANYKSFSADSAVENNHATDFILEQLSSHLWSNTAAITSIMFTPGSGSWAQYSTFYLYGIKNS